nr:unnamed protein product [Digitaria exilis]
MVLVVTVYIITRSESAMFEAQVSLDLLMMAVTSGKERDEDEWRKIFMDAGFRRYKARPLLCFLSIIELYPTLRRSLPPGLADARCCLSAACYCIRPSGCRSFSPVAHSMDAAGPATNRGGRHDRGPAAAAGHTSTRERPSSSASSSSSPPAPGQERTGREWRFDLVAISVQAEAAQQAKEPTRRPKTVGDRFPLDRHEVSLLLKLLPMLPLPPHLNPKFMRASSNTVDEIREAKGEISFGDQQRCAADGRWHPWFAAAFSSLSSSVVLNLRLFRDNRAAHRAHVPACAATEAHSGKQLAAASPDLNRGCIHHTPCAHFTSKPLLLLPLLNCRAPALYSQLGARLFFLRRCWLVDAW